jgi:hypothetical protein
MPSQGQVVGQYPECFVPAQRAYGVEVTTVESENDVSVVVGREGYVHGVRQVQVEAEAAGAQGLGSPQMIFRDPGDDDAAAAHPVPDVVDRAECRFTAEFARGDVVDLGEQQRRHHQQPGGHDRFVRRPVLGVGRIKRRQQSGCVRDDDDQAADPVSVSRPTASATASRTSRLVGVRPAPSKVREKRGSSQTRFAMAAR